MSCRFHRLIASFTLSLCFGAAPLWARPAPFSLMVNEDNDHYFHRPSSEMTVPALQKYVDGIVSGGVVSEMVFCLCGQPANWDSSAWEPVWKRLDQFPDLYARHPDWRRWPANAKLLHDRGIDPYRVWIDRCREKGVGAWLSMRMNDVHFTTHKLMQYLRTVAFWRDHPEYRRYPQLDPFAKLPGEKYEWKFFALDYSHPEVREYARSLVREILARYAPDGLELDWMRYVTHLTPGREREQAFILTDFMREARRLADAAGRACGHRIMLSVRIPSNYAFARDLGYDPEVWAREGLVDLVIPCNKDSADFACNVSDWKRRLAPVRVIPGMDRFDCAGGPKVYADFAGYCGWADAMHVRGAEGVYLFNAIYCSESLQRELWTKGLGDSVCRSHARRYVASYPDSAPDVFKEAALPQLTWILAAPHAIRVPVGTISEGRSCEAVLAFDAEPPADLAVTLNGVSSRAWEALGPSEWGLYGAPGRIKSVRRYWFADVPLSTASTACVEVTPVAGSPVRVMWCEILAR